ncbi:MAG: hypothetical protein JXR76_23385 [Deltaproteobacteria bacterium]|nr:hypothetical protein [Deltaproteobacteria bacterium]
MRNSLPSRIKSPILLFSLIWLIAGNAGCQSREKTGRLEVYRLARSQMRRPMDYAVLKAPKEMVQDKTKVPVFVLLHGMGDDHTSLDKYGIADYLHTAMVNGDIPPAHFVVPNGEKGFYLNWYDDSHPYEKLIMLDVIPSALKVLGLRQDYPLHIIGVSMGGAGALRIGLNYPHRFVSISVFSALIFTEEEAQKMMKRPLVRLLMNTERIWGDGSDPEFAKTLDVYGLSAALEPDLRPRIFITSGTRENDAFTESAMKFTAHLSKMAVPYRYQSFEGKHGWKYWQKVLPDALHFALWDTVRP